MPQAESHPDPAATKARRLWRPTVAAQTTTTGTTETTTTGTARTCFHPKEAGIACPHRQKTKIAIATIMQILGQKVQNSWGRFCSQGSKYRGQLGQYGTMDLLCSLPFLSQLSLSFSQLDTLKLFLCFCLFCTVFVFVCTLFVSGQYNCSCYGKPTCECV